ncbi:valine--tRNA ligase [candidate division LCP-89 bacterium B3_LCP]|uniref:Valine--tRNA ligase n=1 Tax=candidate division LCP-89 bacterium B3_LCP TaxID=2012998 RepID=A0A532UZR3_UNCL8|nr:MAG: valine--tRNA ligase [candidate division LCP-89 bacterium B3_LCP]
MPELAKTYDPKIVEDKWYKFWEENDFFHTEPNPDKEPYVIMMPPPNVTGILHMGHALQDSVQDALIRYHRMKGREALWMPGMDHAGIATQNVVEKKLADEGVKKEDLGREAFIDEVWKWKEKHGGIISQQKRCLGDSPDWNRQRFTMDEGMSRTVTEAFVRLYNEGLIYRGDYIVNWCPRCRTAISDEEVDHRDIEGNLWYVKYPIKDSDDHLTVATTRPETMLGDTGVAANPKDERYRHLKGKIAILPVLGRELPIIFDDYVDKEFGTGLVKVTPAHDPNDFEMGKRHDLPSIKVMDEGGILTAEAGEDFQGMDRFECRDALVKRLEDHGFIEKVEKHSHSVGHCQRCKTMIEPYLSRQWFVNMKPLAEPAIEAVKSGKIKFVPKRWEKVYLAWLENIRDWCISRQLWWGHRIPVYRCSDCGYEWASVDPPDKCPQLDSNSIEQDPDVLDTWFSSWLWPFSTLGWPEDNKDLNYYYPTDVLVSGYDIIFFWIARMIMAGLKFTGKEPYHTVYITGMIKDELGRWMSKSLGNGIDPLEMIEKYGTDAVRYSLVVLTTEGQDIRLAPSRFEMGRNFANKLWNAARFLFMQDKPERFTVTAPEKLELEDRWILSRLQNMLRTVEKNVKRYRLNEALLAIYDFTWHDYCDWYVELIKPRLYQSDDPVKREGTLALALKIFETALRALHPFMPFVTEELWQQIAAIDGLDIQISEPRTIMRQQYPESAKRFIDKSAESDMDTLQNVIQAVRNIRADMGVPPKAKAQVLVTGPDSAIQILQEHSHMLETLAGIDNLTNTTDRPEHSASAIVGELEIFVPLEGLIDLDIERSRLEKEITRHEGMLEGIKKKLSNESFIKKAPENIVLREREKENSLEEKLSKFKKNRLSLS